MPRQRSAGRAPARPTVPSRAPSNPTHQQQSRPATTHAPAHAAAPTATPPAPVAAGGGGMLGNIASTAAGVAIGSTVGHAVSGLFGFGGSNQAADPVDQNNSVASQGQQAQNNTWGNNCADATQQFTKCLDEQGGNMQICGWYLEQLKACQAAAKPY